MRAGARRHGGMRVYCIQSPPNGVAIWSVTAGVEPQISGYTLHAHGGHAWLVACLCLDLEHRPLLGE
eukprot:410535-Prymnesium_polylepis.2